jgi:hypothetical protein
MALKQKNDCEREPSSPWCNGPDFGMAVFVA